MFKIFHKKNAFQSPIGGKLVHITDVPDQVFAKKMMGEGYAIIPNTNTILAPISGTITFITETNHAIGITSKSGFETLIHIGVDSVLLKGKGFQPKVKIGDIVAQGDCLMQVDFNYLKKHCKSEMIIILFPNAKSIKLLKPNKYIQPLEEDTISIIMN